MTGEGELYDSVEKVWKKGKDTSESMLSTNNIKSNNNNVNDFINNKGDNNDIQHVSNLDSAYV